MDVHGLVAAAVNDIKVTAADAGIPLADVLAVLSPALHLAASAVDIEIAALVPEPGPDPAPIPDTAITPAE